MRRHALQRINSGLPYSRTNATGDSLIGLPNDTRLPTTTSVDLLVRRPLRLGSTRGGLYLDVRNLFNRRNIVAVRRDTGEPGMTQGAIDSLAEALADIDGNRYVEGRDELFPRYLAAARDFTQPLFAYGPPRLVRLGVEFLF